jgi:hypothetical protein
VAKPLTLILLISVRYLKTRDWIVLPLNSTTNRDVGHIRLLLSCGKAYFCGH